MVDIGGYQVSDAVPYDDGSLQTTLYDASGAAVATVTRYADGATEAELTNGDGIDWAGIVDKVTGFLDGAAKIAREVSRETERIAGGIRGGARGAAVGYRTTDWTPLLIGGGIVVALMLLSRRN